jgi:hypothetical protein
MDKVWKPNISVSKILFDIGDFLPIIPYSVLKRERMVTVRRKASSLCIQPSAGSKMNPKAWRPRMRLYSAWSGLSHTAKSSDIWVWNRGVMMNMFRCHYVHPHFRVYMCVWVEGRVVVPKNFWNICRVLMKLLGFHAVEHHSRFSP